ncbi:MAG: alpha/beta fold hydrolase [Chloroflexi bacterium]|nr:alpha/beta fold hydrolase [Chloroflexota bacterium]
MPYASVNSVRIFYNIYGGDRDSRNSAIVLLHGLGSSGDDWPLQLMAFAPQHRVIAVDARGHGRSDKPRGGYSVAQMADDLAELLAQLGEPPAHLVGLSLGGCAALQMAISQPARVRSLVLVNTFARLRPAGWRGALRFARRLWLLAFAPMRVTAEFIARGLFPKPEQHLFYKACVARLAANPKRSYFNAIRALVTFDAASRLREIACPTLVVAGERDATIPLSVKERLARGIPGAQLIIIPDSGHATPYDQAARFNRIVLEFVGDVALRERREMQSPG